VTQKLDLAPHSGGQATMLKPFALLESTTFLYFLHKLLDTSSSIDNITT
jgi:hypothetical protein